MSEKYPFTLIKKELARRKGEALDFAVGQPAFPVSDEMTAWIREHADLALAPGTPDDIGRFAQTAAVFLQTQYGVDIDPAQILPTAGGRAAMGILAACTLSTSSTVVVTEPGYPAFARLVAQLGARVVACQLDPGNRFAPDFEYSKATPRGSVAMVAVNYPNNPSGGTLSDAVLDKLRSLAADGLTFFNDATYAPLVYGEQPRSLLDEDFSAGIGCDVIELHSFSKHYAVGPLAVAFLVGSAEPLDAIATYSEYAWSPLSKLQLAGTAKCLEDTERLQRIRQVVPARLTALRDVLADIGFRPYEAHAGTYLICDVPDAIAGRATGSAAEAARRLMDEFDVAVVPLGGDGHSYLRFTALYRPRDLERLAGLGAALRLS